MSSTQMDWRALCGELSDALAARHPGHVDDQELIDRTRAELAHSEPKVGPTRLRTERRTGPLASGLLWSRAAAPPRRLLGS